MPLNNINNKMAKGAAWLVSFRLLDRSLGLISTLVLARLLVPADFGLIAMAMTILAVLDVLSAFGFDTALIQQPDIQRRHYDTVWTFGMIFHLACAVALALLASPAAQFYSEPRLVAVMYCVAAGYFLSSFHNIGPIDFRRHLEFDREFKFLLTKRLIGFLATVLLAVILRSYWALVLGTLVNQVCGVLLSYVVHPYRPRLSLAGRKDLFKLSWWLLANNIIMLINNKSADFVIGRMAGASALGVYGIAYQISNLPTSELVAPINRAAFPGYSRLAGEREKLRDSFLDVISMIALFVLPAGIGIALIADLMVPVILGEKWLAAVPLIQIFAIYGIIVALQTNIYYIYVAIGKPRVMTVIAVAQLIVLLCLLVPGVKYLGTVGAAWAFLGSVVLMIPLNQGLVIHQLGTSLPEYWSRMWRPFVACVAMGVTVYAVKSMFGPLLQTAVILTALITSVAVGALVYISALYGLWRLSASPYGAERFCLSRIEQVLGRAGLDIKLVAR